MQIKIIFLCFFVFPYVLFAGDSLNNHTEFMSPRNAVIEMFCNTGSVMGAESYGTLNDYIRKNPDGIIPIVYHTYSPFPNDPFYQINKAMNLNRWSNYTNHFDMSLDNSATVGGHYFAQDRTDADSTIRAINWQKGIVVPVKMSIDMVKDSDSAEITVNIKAVGEFGKRTVFIYLMDTYYTKYNIGLPWRSDVLTPNSELYFRWIPRAMVPDENGLEVKLYEGSDTTLKIKVPIKTTGFQDNKKLYAIAVLQSPTSTNLIQAVTTYNPMRAKVYFQDKEIHTGDSAYIQIKRDQKNYFTYTLENPYNYEQTYKVKLYCDSKIFYSSLRFFEDTLYTLKPHEKKDLQFMVVSQYYADFTRIDIVVNPISVPDPTMQEDAVFFSVFAITDGIYCATLHTYPKLEKDAEALDNLVMDFSQDWAVCPYDVFMKGYIDMPIKLYYLMTDTRNIPTFGLNKKRVDFCLSLLERGKGVILTSVYELAMAQNAYKNINYISQPAMSSLLADKIGITLGTHYNLYVHPTYPYFPEINVFGVQGTEFGKNVNVQNTVINYGRQYIPDSVITKTSNLESIKLNGNNPKTQGFLKYDILDAPADEFAGVSTEIGDGRLLYIGFGLENSTYYGRRNIIENAMYWLIKGFKPKRASLTLKPREYIDFGTKEIYKDTTAYVNISNTGDTTLLIRDIYINKFNESFTFDTSAIVYKLNPGQSFNLPIKFMPKKRQTMQTSLNVDSDAYYSSFTSLTLFGIGVLTEKKTPPNDGEDNYWLDISSKSQSDNVNIKFKPNKNAKNIKITLIDSEGNRYNLPYSPEDETQMQSYKFNKKLFSSEKYELLVEIDGKVIRKNINPSEGK
ncbi:MAG: hypothetical protein WCR42_08515 [bacterium]